MPASKHQLAAAAYQIRPADIMYGTLSIDEMQEIAARLLD
jgi:hypothetical protein